MKTGAKRGALIKGNNTKENERDGGRATPFPFASMFAGGSLRWARARLDNSALKLKRVKNRIKYYTFGNAHECGLL